MRMVDQPVRSLSRRLLALLLILMMTAAGAFVGWSQTANTYQSGAAVVVVPAPGGTSGTGGSANPLTGLDENIARLALVVSAQMDADAVRDKVVAAGGDGRYVADTRSSQDDATARLSPVIKLTASGSTAEGAQKTTRVLMVQASDQLASVQSAADVPAAARARVIELSPAAAGAVIGHPRPQSAAVFGAAAGLAALLLMVIAGWLSRARPRTAVAAAPTAPATWVAPTPDRSAAPAPAPASVSQPMPEDERRFAQPSDDAAVAVAAPGARRRQEVLREIVREDWQRSGSNVPWTRREQRAAYDRAEQRLCARDRRLHDLEIENVRGHDDFLDFLDFRDHG